MLWKRNKIPLGVDIALGLLFFHVVFAGLVDEASAQEYIAGMILLGVAMFDALSQNAASPLAHLMLVGLSVLAIWPGLTSHSA